MLLWHCNFTLDGISGFFEEDVRAMTSMEAQAIIERKYGAKTLTFTFRLIQ